MAEAKHVSIGKRTHLLDARVVQLVVGQVDCLHSAQRVHIPHESAELQDLEVTVRQIQVRNGVQCGAVEVHKAYLEVALRQQEHRENTSPRKELNTLSYSIESEFARYLRDIRVL